MYPSSSVWLCCLSFCTVGSQMYHSFFFCTARVPVFLYSKTGSQMYKSFSFVQHGCLPCCTVIQGLRYTTLSSSVQHGCLSCCTAQMGIRCFILSFFLYSFGVCLAVHFCRVLYESPSFCTAWLSVLLYSKTGSQMDNSFSFVQHGCLSCYTAQMGLRCFILYLFLYGFGACLAVHYSRVLDLWLYFCTCSSVLLYFCILIVCLSSSVRLGCLSFCTEKHGLRCTTLSSSVQHGCLPCWTAQQGLRCFILSLFLYGFGVYLAVHYCRVLYLSPLGCLSCCTAQQGLRCTTLSSSGVPVFLYIKAGFQMYNSFSFVQHGCLSCCTAQ